MNKEQAMDLHLPGQGDNDILGGHGSEIANRFLRDRVIRMAHRETPASRVEFEAERNRRRAELKRALGLDPMPAKTPLNVRRTGVVQGDGFRIEKVAFESRPRFFVTAHVYVPDRPTRTRMPAIVNVNGHWDHKKDEDRIQLRCQFEALRGYVAIAIDSPGFSFEGDHLIERRAEGTHDDYKLVEGGSNATGYYVWDTIRAVDYLATRPDVDMNRLGITGASGGGLATLYAFAAEDRFKAAVPVVYMASLEQAPDNGCLCNHVPGTCQIGDRSDVAAIQAPKPVMLIGAEQDGEFPAEATRLTSRKMAASWALFGKSGDVQVRIFPGGHDYSQPMREAMIGFFDKYLRDTGDGTPVPQPPLHAIDPEDRRLLVLDPPPPNERTMRDISREYLESAPSRVSVDRVLELNGGLPARSDLHYREIGNGRRRGVVFESEPGLQTPGVLVLPDGPISRVRIVASDAGKAAEIANHPAVTGDGTAYLFLDILGTGELSRIEMRYAVYAGTAISFTGGWQIARAAEAMRRYRPEIEVMGRGPVACQAAMYAGLMDRGFKRVVGIGGLHQWSDVFDSDVSDYAVQPRAHLCCSLDALRKKVRNAQWLPN